MMKVKVKVPATTANLGPGFDCLGAALSLYNFIEIETTDRGLVIAVQGEGAEAIERNEQNLVFRAIAAAFAHAGQPLPGLHLRLTNHIPLARGLGSSAACVAGGLIAANWLLGNALSLPEMVQIGTEIEGHPDNLLPALLGGAVVCARDQGKIKFVKLPGVEGLQFVAAIPALTLKTAVARKALPDTVPFADAVFNVSRAALLTAALATGEFAMLRLATQDMLHQPFRKNLIPGMDEVIRSAYEAGACGAFLSGAGPTVMALATNCGEKIGQAMVETFIHHGTSAMAMVLTPDTQGTTVVDFFGGEPE